MCDLTARLVAEISRICHAADLIRGNRPGTAERGLYFWHYEDDPNFRYSLDILDLQAFRRDAVEFLNDTLAEFVEKAA
jgi:hypothetical protein